MTGTPSGSGTLRYLLVEAGEQLCALPLERVRRVLRAHPVFPLPGAAAELLGLSELGGEPLPVLDVGLLLGSPHGSAANPPVTVVAMAGPGERQEQVGLAADAALDIVEISPGDLAGGDGALVRGEALVAGRPVRVVDLEALEGEK